MKSNQRLTIEFVTEQFRVAGCELLSTEYKNARTPLTYRCICGKVATIRYDNFRQCKICNSCRYIKIANKKRHSLDFIRKEFKDAGCHIKFHKTYGFGNNTEFQFIEWLSTGGKPHG